MMKDDVFIASLVQYGFLDQVYSRIKNELRYLPDMNELRMVVSAADSLSRHYIEMGSNPVTEEEALEFIEDCSKYPSYVIPGLDMPWEEYGPFGKVANDGRALEIINTLKRSSLATSLDDHPQGVSLKQAAMEAREASAKLFDKNVGADIAPPEETNARRDVQMEHDRDVMPDVDDTTVSVTSSLYDVQTLLNDDSDAHEDGHAVLREAVQVTSHGRVVSNAVHERPVTIHGESARARAAAAVLAANMDAEEEAEDKEEKSRNR